MWSTIRSFVATCNLLHIGETLKWTATLLTNCTNLMICINKSPVRAFNAGCTQTKNLDSSQETDPLWTGSPINYSFIVINIQNLNQPDFSMHMLKEQFANTFKVIVNSQYLFIYNGVFHCHQQLAFTQVTCTRMQTILSNWLKENNSWTQHNSITNSIRKMWYYFVLWPWILKMLFKLGLIVLLADHLAWIRVAILPVSRQRVIAVFVLVCARISWWNVVAAICLCSFHSLLCPFISSILDIWWPFPNPLGSCLASMLR